MDNIWDPYLTTKREGSGLGLATCYSIAENHGGTMCVQSTPMAGTTFSLWLPAIESEATVERGQQPRQQLTLPDLKVITMDDQAAIRIVSTRILENFGQKVTAVDDGTKLIGQYKSAIDEGDPFDLVILDMTIPGGMGGSETLSKLKTIDPLVYSVVCSGYTDENNLNQFTELGFDDMLPKPFNANDVETMLHNFMSSQQLPA
ncbi:MAG: response regulator [Verrucomicrobiota bacterium]